MSFLNFNSASNSASVNASPLEVLKARRAAAKAELEAKAQVNAKAKAEAEKAEAEAKAKAEKEANPLFKAAAAALELHEEIQEQAYQMLTEAYVVDKAVESNLAKAEQAKAKEEEINAGLVKLQKELNVVANNVVVKQNATQALRAQAKAVREENEVLLSELKVTSFMDRVKALREVK